MKVNWQNSINFTGTWGLGLWHMEVLIQDELKPYIANYWLWSNSDHIDIHSALNQTIGILAKWKYFGAYKTLWNRHTIYVELWRTRLWARIMVLTQQMYENSLDSLSIQRKIPDDFSEPSLLTKNINCIVSNLWKQHLLDVQTGSCMGSVSYRPVTKFCSQG